MSWIEPSASQRKEVERIVGYEMSDGELRYTSKLRRWPLSHDIDGHADTDVWPATLALIEQQCPRVGPTWLRWDTDCNYLIVFREGSA